MLRLSSVLALASVLCFACDSGEKPKADAETKEAAKPKPKPFEGELTVVLVEGMKGDAKPKPFDPWEDALAQVASKLGQPTKIDGKNHSWAVVEGEKCAYFTIEKDGDKVGIVDGPGTIDKMMKEMHAECMLKSGAEPAPEDPNAPVPPTDGAAVAPTVLKAGVGGAPSKWVGQTVKVTGVYLSTSTTSSKGSDAKTVTLSIRDDKESKESIGCTLEAGTEAPKIVQYDPITVSGTVTDTFGGGLDACKIVPGDAAAPAEGDAAAADGDADAAEADAAAEGDDAADEGDGADEGDAEADAE